MLTARGFSFILSFHKLKSRNVNTDDPSQGITEPIKTRPICINKLVSVQFLFQFQSCLYGVNSGATLPLEKRQTNVTELSPYAFWARSILDSTGNCDVTERDSLTLSKTFRTTGQERTLRD